MEVEENDRMEVEENDRPIDRNIILRAIGFGRNSSIDKRDGENDLQYVCRMMRHGNEWLMTIVENDRISKRINKQS